MTTLEKILEHYEVNYNPNVSGEQSILCPVHDERVKSCSLNIGKELWSCHACGKAGGAEQIVMAREGVSLAAATAFVQKLTGDSSSGLRTGDSQSRRVPKGQGFTPGYRRKIQNGRRDRPTFGS